MKTLKNGQKQTIEFDRWCKNAKHQQTYYELKNRGDGGYIALVNYQSLVSKNFPLAPPLPPFIFLYKD